MKTLTSHPKNLKTKMQVLGHKEITYKAKHSHVMHLVNTSFVTATQPQKTIGSIIKGIQLYTLYQECLQRKNNTPLTKCL